MVRIGYLQLDQYLRTYYPLNDDCTDLVAKIYLLLPPNHDRTRTMVTFTDITHLFKLMTQNALLTCTVGHSPCHLSCQNDHALDEARELQDLLFEMTENSLPVLDSILAVRLVLCPAEWEQPFVFERPAIWIIFKEHTVLPGEWPWYGACNLNRESILLWEKWWHSLGIPNPKKWLLHFKVQRGTEEIVKSTVIPHGIGACMVMSEQGLLKH